MEESSFRVCWRSVIEIILFIALLNHCKGQSLDGITRSGFPGLHEIADNALHLYRLPRAERQYIQEYSFYVYEDRLYKHSTVNFTCSGNITKLMFVAWRGRLESNITDTREMLWPKFSLLRFLHKTETRRYYRQLELLVSSQNPLPILESGNIGIYEVVLHANNSFEAGDYLGLWQPLYHNSSSRVALTVLHQRKGGHSYYDYSSSMSWTVVWEYSDNFFPLVAIETVGNCTQGFLNNKSLEMIVKAMQNNHTSSSESLFFSRYDRQFITPNTAFISSGTLTKWAFAARFNRSNTKLPELQVWRKISENKYTKLHGISIEPRRTGYLNVFELHLPQTLEYRAVKIQAGDMFGVYQPGEDEARYSLAFLQSPDGPLTYMKVLPSLLNNNSYSDITLSSFTLIKIQPLVTAALGEAQDSEDDGSSTSTHGYHLPTTTPITLDGGSINRRLPTTTPITLYGGPINHLPTTIPKILDSRPTIVSSVLSVTCVLLVLVLVTITVTLILVIIKYRRLSQRSNIICVAGGTKESDVNEVLSVSSETEVTGLLTCVNEAYDLGSQATSNSPGGTGMKGSNESLYEDITGEHEIYDYIAAN